MLQPITPYLLYEDVEAALEFLGAAFGFHEHLRFTASDGSVNHAEARLGDGVVYLGDPGDDYRSPRRVGQASADVYVLVDDVDAHFEKARAAGAEILEEPVDQPYGDRRYRAVDPEGHRWHFAHPIAEVAPEEWGAQVASTS